jgi:hypothetical protein
MTSQPHTLRPDPFDPAAGGLRLDGTPHEQAESARVGGGRGRAARGGGRCGAASALAAAARFLSGRLGKFPSTTGVC